MNNNLPADKQDIDNLEDTTEMEEYLAYGVKEGCIDEDLANEIIEKGQWYKVKEMMFIGDAYANDNERELSEEEMEAIEHEAVLTNGVYLDESGNEYRNEQGEAVFNFEKGK